MPDLPPHTIGGCGPIQGLSQPTICPNNPQVCFVNAIILLLSIESELPQSQIHKYQTCLIFTTPDLAASNGIPRAANEIEQTRTLHQPDVVYLVTNMATKLCPKPSEMLKIKTRLWNYGNNASAISCKTNQNRADRGKARAETGGVGHNR